MEAKMNTVFSIYPNWTVRPEHTVQHQIRCNRTGHVIRVYTACPLTHCSRETRKRVIGKQCTPRSDAAERGV